MARVLRISALVGAVALSGCVTSNTVRSGTWVIDQRPDQITGAPVGGAYTMVWGATKSGDPSIYSASLQLTCFENRPIAKLAFQFRIGSDRNTSFGYRFDDKPGHDAVESRVLFGNRVLIVDDDAALRQFIAELRGSTKLFVRIRALNAGNSAVEFKVDGSEPAIEAAYAGCPLPPLPSGRTS
ncbi:hypothetical protein LPW26_03775 [Rhodopseudomonas sp. HC1]|uniref:hypothetical protein n=1 Tax=Rhodopseudomonas infernalis TaxID=2897386 RepID=UPI001EE9ACC3|nr:hypothetical protein [Rhodopseudomonas infernalis]MCG6203745.1 hypothetical protein [Rhodopseudomonas infernalis]